MRSQYMPRSHQLKSQPLFTPRQHYIWPGAARALLVAKALSAYQDILWQKAPGDGRTTGVNSNRGRRTEPPMSVVRRISLRVAWNSGAPTRPVGRNLLAGWPCMFSLVVGDHSVRASDGSGLPRPGDVRGMALLDPTAAWPRWLRRPLGLEGRNSPRRRLLGGADDVDQVLPENQAGR